MGTYPYRASQQALGPTRGSSGGLRRQAGSAPLSTTLCTTMPVKLHSTSKHHAAFIATFFCLAWLLVLLAGADHPPPVGFLGILPLLPVGVLLAHWRVTRYPDWKSQYRHGEYFAPLKRARLLSYAAVFRVGSAAGIRRSRNLLVTESCAPGVKTVWLGMQRLRDFVEGMEHMQAIYNAN